MATQPKITKKHHYVHRAYLSAWTSDRTTSGSLWCLMKPSGKVINSNVMNLAQQRYFYEFKKLTELEKMMVGILGRSKNKNIMALNPYHILMHHCKIWALEKQIEPIDENVGFDAIRKQSGEMLQGVYEQFGPEYLDKLTEEDCSFFLEQETRMDFISYLMMQYVRTDRMRSSWKKVFANLVELKLGFENEILQVKGILGQNGVSLCEETVRAELCDIDSNLSMDKVYPYILDSITTELTYAFAVGNSMRLEFLKAPDGINFITADQPAVNLAADPFNEAEIPKSMVLYYPIGPKTAIRLVEDKNWNVAKLNLAATEVENLNQAMYDFCKMQVYSISDDEFKKLDK